MSARCDYESEFAPMKIFIKHRGLWIPLVLALFIAIYMAWPADGFYRRTQSEELRYRGGGLAITDLAQWNPEGCRWQPVFKQIDGRETFP
jgi:hypothetical protein